MCPWYLPPEADQRRHETSPLAPSEKFTQRQRIGAGSPHANGSVNGPSVTFMCPLWLPTPVFMSLFLQLGFFHRLCPACEKCFYLLWDDKVELEDETGPLALAPSSRIVLGFSNAIRTCRSADWTRWILSPALHDADQDKRFIKWMDV